MAAGGGDRDVTFRFLADVGDAVEGVKSVGTEVKELGTEIKETAKAPDELALAMARAEKATAKLSDPNISPRGLQRAVLDADIATENLAAAMKKAAATGGPTPPAMVASLKGFETAVASANVRAGQLRDRLADMRVKGDQAAQGFEKMAQFGGSAQGMMQGLADTNEGLLGGFAKLSLAVVGTFEAFKVGLAIGNQVRDAWKTMVGTEMPNLTNAFTRLITGIDKASEAFDRSGTPITVYRDRLAGVKLAADLVTQALDKKSAELAKLTPAVAAATLRTQGYAAAFDTLSKRVGDFILTSAGVGQVSFDMSKTMLGTAASMNAVTEADAQLIRATNAYKGAAKDVITAQADYDQSLQKTSGNTTSLGEYTKDAKDEIDRLESKLKLANIQLVGTSRALTEAALAAQKAVPAFDPLAGAFFTAEEAAGAADKTIGTMEFTIGKSGETAKALGGGFKGAAVGIDEANRAGVNLTNATGPLTASIAGMAGESGPVKKLGGGFKGVADEAKPAATAIGEISNKTGDLVAKITPLTGEEGHTKKLAGGFGAIKDAGQKLIEKNDSLILSIAGLNVAMETSIGVAARYQAAMAAAAGAKK